MKRSSGDPSVLPVIPTLLAIAFAFLTIRAGKLTSLSLYMAYVHTTTDLRWVFWLMLGLTVICLIPMVGFILRGLQIRGLLPRKIDRLYAEDSRQKRRMLLSIVQSRLHTLGGQFLLVGLAILFVVGALSRTPALRERELGTYLNEWTLGILGLSKAAGGPVSVYQIPLIMDGGDNALYLKNCEKVVGDLAGIGAKAVLVDVQDMETSHTKTELEMIQQLNKSGIVVLGAKDFYGFPNAGLSCGIVTLSESEVRGDPLLNRIQPVAGRNPDRAGDLTVELLRKYNGYPERLLPQREGSVVKFGNYQIPVTNDGFMYARDKWGEVAFWPRIYAIVGEKGDSLKYRLMRNGVRYTSNLNELRSEFQGKIFLIGRVRGSLLDNFVFTKVYAAALQSILDNSVIRKAEWSPLWITALCIAISASIAHRLRFFTSILATFLLGVVLIVADSILYDRMNLIIEIIYPLLSILMTMVIFPVLALVHRLGSPHQPAFAPGN
jgi:hypothetical protein